MPQLPQWRSGGVASPTGERRSPIAGALRDLGGAVSGASQKLAEVERKNQAVEADTRAIEVEGQFLAEAQRVEEGVGEGGKGLAENTALAIQKIRDRAPG